MAWICGKHLGVEVPDGQPCATCNPPFNVTDGKGNTSTVRLGSVGKAWTPAEIIAQKAAFEAANGVGSWDAKDADGKQSPTPKVTP